LCGPPGHAIHKNTSPSCERRSREESGHKQFCALFQKSRMTLNQIKYTTIVLNERDETPLSEIAIVDILMRQ
jgi:hypothetical protein